MAGKHDGRQNKAAAALINEDESPKWSQENNQVRSPAKAHRKCMRCTCQRVYRIRGLVCKRYFCLRPRVEGAVILKRKHKQTVLCLSLCWAQSLWASQNATSRAGHTHTNTPNPCCYGNRALKRGKEFWRMQKCALRGSDLQENNWKGKCKHFIWMSLFDLSIRRRVWFVTFCILHSLFFWCCSAYFVFPGHIRHLTWQKTLK